MPAGKIVSQVRAGSALDLGHYEMRHTALPGLHAG